MKYHIDIIDGIKDICIIVNKGIVSDEETCFVTNKYKTLLNEMDEVYPCIRSSIVDDNFIEKPRIQYQKTIFLLRESKLPVTPSANLLEDRILNQMGTIEGCIADKTEDHVEISYQVGKLLKKKISMYY